MEKLSTKNIVYACVRWAIVIAFLVVLIIFAGQNKISHAKFEDVGKAVVESVDTAKMQKGNDSTFKRLYGLDSADYEKILLYWPKSNMDAEELLLVQLKDVAQQQAVLDAIQARLETQKKSFDGYGTNQYALLSDNATADAQGNYILFVVGADNAKADAAFKQAL